MSSTELDSSLFDPVESRRRHGHLSALEAVLKGDEAQEREFQARIEAAEGLRDESDDDWESDVSEMIESVIDGELEATLGKKKRKPQLLEELIPKIDFNAIPLTQPKRVLAKSAFQRQGEDETAMRSDASSRRKRPVSLLDTYFKGI